MQNIIYENPHTIQLNIPRNLSQQQMKSSAFYQPPVVFNGNNTVNYPAANQLKTSFVQSRVINRQINPSQTSIIPENISHNVIKGPIIQHIPQT